MTTSDVRHALLTRVAPATAVLPPPRGRKDADDQKRGATTPPVLYGCFSCPWCYLASQRTNLIADRALRPLWRMVDPEPRLPGAGRARHAIGRHRHEAGQAAVFPMLLPGERLPPRLPTFIPNTGPAVVGYAEAVGAGVGDRVRELLFDAYWHSGADIGNPEILRRLLAAPVRAGHSTSWPLRDFGYAVSLAGGPITNDAYYRIRKWHAGWHTAAGTALPTLVDCGTTISGQSVFAALGNKIRNETSAGRLPPPERGGMQTRAGP